MSEQMVQCGSDKNKKKFNTALRYKIPMHWRRLYWWTLHFTKLARPYSVWLCKRGRYPFFSDGRCMWCGEKHE